MVQRTILNINAKFYVSFKHQQWIENFNYNFSFNIGYFNTSYFSTKLSTYSI